MITKELYTGSGASGGSGAPPTAGCSMGAPRKNLWVRRGKGEAGEGGGGRIEEAPS
jgi:hypothetical protein